MGKKKKTGWDQFTTFEDFANAMRERSSTNDNGEQDGDDIVKLENFVVTEKVDAFANAFATGSEDRYDERFDDARLREFFKAYVCPSGDPLVLYIELLATYGFHLEVDTVTCEPCIFARRKI